MPSADGAKPAGTESPIRDLDDNYETEADLEDEESWTFIGDEADPELRKRIEEFEISKIGGRAPRVSLNLEKERNATKRMSSDMVTSSLRDARHSTDIKRPNASKQ